MTEEIKRYKLSVDEKEVVDRNYEELRNGLKEEEDE